jgi:glucosylceramidase
MAGEAQVLEGDSASGLDLSVDESARHQRIDGFGGAFNERGWDALLVLDEAARVAAVGRLFDPESGARFVYGRLPIGASDYALSRYTFDDVPGDLALDHFSIARDLELLIPYIRAALAYQPALRLWGSAWTPPPWMKTNGAYDSGAMRDDPLVLDAYARYLARFVEAYAAEGLAIEAVHVQNEPAQEARYPSCLWTPELIRDFVRDHMGPAFRSRQGGAEIWLGTLNYPDHAYADVTLRDPVARGFVSGIGVQWGALEMVPYLAATYPDLPIMQTETVCGNHPWEPGFDLDRPANDHAYGMRTWGRIHDYLEAGASSYMAWNMVLDSEGKNLDSERPWPQNALLVVDQQAREIHETPAYWAFRHFSAHVDVGALRLEMLGRADDAIAFLNPDGRVVVALRNSEGTPRTITLSVRGDVLEIDLPAWGWVTLSY